MNYHQVVCMHIQVMNLIELQVTLHVGPAPAMPKSQLEASTDIGQPSSMALKLISNQPLCRKNDCMFVTS